jgi:hypothetical protein
MLKEVTCNVFKKDIPQGLSHNVDFVKVTANTFGAKSVFYIFYEENFPLIGFALYNKGKDIVLPKFYPYYSGIWLNGSLNESKIRKSFHVAIKVLANIYSSIHLLLPPEIKDVRGFIFNDFDVRVKYTFIKNTADIKFKNDVLKNFRRAERELKLTFYTNELDHQEWFNHNNQLKSIGFSNKSLTQLKEWILALELIGCIKTFYLKGENDANLGSGIVILDEYSKTAGFLLSHVPKGKYQSELNASLYIYIQLWLKDNGFVFFNYLGANTLSIAEFKSRFEPELVSYFQVSLSKYSALRGKLISKIKRFLKR